MVWRLKKKVICLNRRELFGSEMGLRKGARVEGQGRQEAIGGIVLRAI